MLVRFIISFLLIMFVLPALGLVTFTGGLGTGLVATLLVGIIGTVTLLALLPLLAKLSILCSSLSPAVGPVGALVIFTLLLGAVIYGLAIVGAASLRPELALVGFWQTVGAGALLGLVNFLPHKK